MDAGTATVEVRNTDRLFDPTFNVNARPMNQLWLQEQFSGETNDGFRGWVDSYDQGWETFEGVATITATDEFKVLSLDALPVMSPPLESYEAVVMSDEPDGYWRMNDPVEIKKLIGGHPPLPGGIHQLSAGAGDALGVSGAIIPVAGTAIVGDNGGSTGVGYYVVSPGNRIEAYTGTSLDDAVGAPGDVSSLSEMTLEMWVTPSGKANDILARGIVDSVSEMWRLSANNSGQFIAYFRNYGSTDVTLTAGPVGGYQINTWYHVVMTITDNYARLYVNGVQLASGVWNGWFGPYVGGGTYTPFIINNTTNGASWGYDEVAFYRHGLSLERVQAHYTAGVSRGFLAGQNPGVRVNAVLDAAESQAPRSVQAGSQTMRGTFMRGQAPVDELRKCVLAELPDGELFVSGGGTVTFLDHFHQGVSPWNTVQSTYGDDGVAGHLPYVDVDLDYSESFLTNEWNLTREAGQLQTARDQASIDRYFKRPQALTDLPLQDDAVVAYIANQLVGKYKAPTLRILSLSLVTATPDLILETFRLELADRIRLIRTVEGGWIDRQLFIERIDVTGAPEELWTIRLGVTDAAFVFQSVTDTYATFNDVTAAFATFDELSMTEH